MNTASDLHSSTSALQLTTDIETGFNRRKPPHRCCIPTPLTLVCEGGGVQSSRFWSTTQLSHPSGCCRSTPPACSCGGVRQPNFSREALSGVSSTYQQRHHSLGRHPKVQWIGLNVSRKEWALRQPCCGDARLASQRKLGGRASGETGLVDTICTVPPTVTHQPRAGCIRLVRPPSGQQLHHPSGVCPHIQG